MLNSFNLNTQSEFESRHNGPSVSEEKEMLKTLGFNELNELKEKVIPKNILSDSNFSRLGDGLSEFETLKKIKNLMQKNQVLKSYIGLGYHDCITPSVILRHVFENPVWYTAYTPYQPEISQGRLESLLNFQTMISDLTGMQIANASLLDEGTAAAEAMVMAHSICKNKSNQILVASDLHPHVISVLKTRALPLDIEVCLSQPNEIDWNKKYFAIVLAYPNTFGHAVNYSDLTAKAHSEGTLVIADVDLLSLTLLKPPGEWGADIVVGNSQRFGVPLGNGGPHAAFMATQDAHKRLMPGRLVGVSIDSEGKKALRLTLQTREQHIRREKATSNICTSQVLLANIAAMYAVYHGPEGLKKIATRIHMYAQALVNGLERLGFKPSFSKNFFDTIHVETPKADQIWSHAIKNGINFYRPANTQALSISINEKTNIHDLEDILKIFAGASSLNFSADSLLTEVKNFSVENDLLRTSPYLTHSVFNSHHSETEMLRYIHSLQNKDLTLAHSMIPLGSCTMKLNATTELIPVSWPEVNGIHPFAPAEQKLGYAELAKDFKELLCDITGFSDVDLAPNSGAQGEYAGLLAIRNYHISRNDSQRKICLIPSSAHGTNPASAVMAGMQVVVVACDDQGNVDVANLKELAQKHRNDLSCLMITYPSTHGVFENSIKEICQIVHDNGGQVYMDGANLNALVGHCRPAEWGVDVSHMNLHKTFAIPHGGGGPGVGPIGVAQHLIKHLQPHITSSELGSASILPISWSYVSMMGKKGLKRATLLAILNANYIAKKLSSAYPILYKGKEGLVAHECILDLRGFKKACGVDVTDVAKRLMDFGFHAPTMSWPVAGTLMVEPTESESKAELDRFIEAMLKIREEISDIENKKIKLEDSPLTLAPHTLSALMQDNWDRKYSRELGAFPAKWIRSNKYWPACGRIDNAYGDRNIVCSCPPIEEYQ